MGVVDAMRERKAYRTFKPDPVPLDIPLEKLIALGIAIGYPDLDNPVTKGHTAREPLDKVVKFYGFE